MNNFLRRIFDSANPKQMKIAGAALGSAVFAFSIHVMGIVQFPRSSFAKAPARINSKDTEKASKSFWLMF